MQKTKDIERAVSHGRIVTATKSMIRFHDVEINRLRIERELFEKEIRTGDPLKAAGISREQN